MNVNVHSIVAAATLAASLAAGAAESLRPWTGAPAPPFVLATPKGESVDLARLRGKVVLVNFWATWCAPCVEEMPALARLRARLAPRGFEVIAVNQGEMPARVGAFLERAGLDLVVAMDRDKEVARAWKVRALPTTFVLDTAGRVRLFAEGELDTGEALDSAIVPLLPRERPISAAR